MSQPVDKKMLAARLAIVYGISIALLIVIFSAFVRPEPHVVIRNVASDKPDAVINDKAIAAARTEVLALQQQLAVKENEIATLKLKPGASVKSDNSELVALKTTMQQREQELASLHQQVQQKDQQLAAAQKQFTTKPKESRPDNTQLNKLKTELAQKEAQIASLRKQSVNTKSTPDDAGTVKDLMTRNENLVKGFNSLQTQLGLMTKNYNLAKAENNRLAEQVRSGKNN